jgi:hypothetical protein
MAVFCMRCCFKNIKKFYWLKNYKHELFKIHACTQTIQTQATQELQSKPTENNYSNWGKRLIYKYLVNKLVV